MTAPSIETPFQVAANWYSSFCNLSVYLVDMCLKYVHTLICSLPGMTSCQPSHSSANSSEWAKNCLGMVYKRCSRNLCVDKFTVLRICQRSECTGSVTKWSYPMEKN